MTSVTAGPTARISPPEPAAEFGDFVPPAAGHVERELTQLLYDLLAAVQKQAIQLRVMSIRLDRAEAIIKGDKR